MSPRLIRWAALQPRVASASRLLVCLDYDGTLAPLAEHPSKARLPERTARALRALARQRRTPVAIISGRALRDVARAVGIPGITYVGNHGLEARGPRLRYAHPLAPRYLGSVRRLARQLPEALRSIAGVWVEDKRLTLSVHWRQTPASRRAACRRLVRRCLAPYVARGVVRVTRGQCVLEIRPPLAWHKGAAIAWLVRRLRRPRPLIVYLGDDQTDEDAFRMTNHLGGLSVFVGDRPRATAARWRLRHPQAVCALLERLSRLFR